MKRLECLDGLRGLLAVYVLLGHMAPFAVLPGWVQTGVSHGGAAVDVFFMLSGLVITQSLQNAGGRAIPFLITRAARIFPVFLAVFAVAVVLSPASCGFERMPWIGPDSTVHTICKTTWPSTWMPEIVAHLTMTHGMFPNGALPDAWVSFLGAAWSLSTEWQFYLLALLVADRGQRLCWILLGLTAAGVVWHLGVPESWQFSRAFLPNKGHFFALGVASVAVVRGERRALGHYLAVLTAAVTICSAQATFAKMLPPLIWTGCLLIQLRPRTPGLIVVGQMLRSRAAGYLGAISYCLYLVNEPIHKVTADVLSYAIGGNATQFTVLWVPSAIGLPILASAVLHRHLEAPALRWGRSIAQRLASDRDATSVQAVRRTL